MIDKRRLRFSSIVGIERSDLPLACEVWLEEVVKAPWSTREAMKLAVHFVRYMTNPDPATLGLREIEGQCGLGPDEVRKTLSLMKNYGAVDDFMCTRDDVKAALNLSLLQRCRVLELKHRHAELAGGNAPPPWTKKQERWDLRETIAVPATPPQTVA